MNHTRDLGIIVSCDLSPSLHVSDIVAKAHKRAAAIHRTFVSRNIHLQVRAFTVYVRPLLEHDSVIWCPFTVHDIEAVESVQRRFTKILSNSRGFKLLVIGVISVLKFILVLVFISFFHQ